MFANWPSFKMWEDETRKCYRGKYKNKNRDFALKKSVENKMNLHVQGNVLQVCLRMHLTYTVSKKWKLKKCMYILYLLNVVFHVDFENVLLF